MKIPSSQLRLYDGRLRVGDTDRSIRSVLFSPAWDIQRLRAAGASDADAVVADLEDMTPKDKKRQARQSVEEWSKDPAGPFLRMVRVNGENSSWIAEDVALLRSLRVDAVFVPKASLKAIDRVAALSLPLVAVLESAEAVRNAYAIASHEGVVALTLGVGDLAQDLHAHAGIPDQLLSHLRSRVLVDAAAADISGPFDGPTRKDGMAALAAECELLRNMGFSGKVATRREDVQVINAIWNDD